MFPNPTGTFTKVTDVHGGAFALRLETKTVATPLGPAIVSGAVSLGNKVNSNSDLGGGLPFTGRPATLQFYYKLSGPQAPVASDGALAEVELTRTVNGRAEIVATARLQLSTVSATYVLAQVPLKYTLAAVPDSVHVVFGTADQNSDNDATVGTVLQVDDVSFTGTATATRDAALAANLSVWPNPSPDGRYVLGGAEPALLAAPLTVLDATGRIVRREAAPGRSAAAATRTLDLSGLPAGVYTVQLFTPRGLVTRKLVR